MKGNFTKIIGAGLITVSMAVLPLTLPVQAQVTDPGTTTAPGTRTDTTTYNDDGDDGFDWGWLGLLGLLGLAGLAGKKRDEPSRYRDPNTVGSTTYRD